LHALLKPFYEADLDLTRVETRPSKSGKWSYVFFIDFAGHCDDPGVASVLEELAAESADVRLLGSYPRAVL
jgi:chorismate mutase/prephenate dehydratase